MKTTLTATALVLVVSGYLLIDGNPAAQKHVAQVHKESVDTQLPTFTDVLTVYISCGGPHVGYQTLAIDNHEVRSFNGNQWWTFHLTGTHQWNSWGSCTVKEKGSE